MGSYSYDLGQLYLQTFGSKPYIVSDPAELTDTSNPYTGIPTASTDTLSSVTGSVLKTKYRDKDIWLPITLTQLPTDKFSSGQWLLPYVTIKMQASADWIETPLIKRKGTAKELYSLGDYVFNLKGFFIDDDNRLFPDKDLNNLKKLWELGTSIGIDNAMTNAFLDHDDMIVIKDFQIMETDGGRVHVKAFTMQIKSDSIFTLEKE